MDTTTSPLVHQRHAISRVSFCEKVRVRPIPRKQAKDVPKLWYTGHEIQAIRHEAHQRAICLDGQQGQPLFTMERGLEFKTPSLAKQRKRSRMACIQAVLDCQEEQDSSRISLPLPKIYLTLTALNRAEAYHRGIRDEQEAYDDCFEPYRHQDDGEEDEEDPVALATAVVRNIQAHKNITTTSLQETKNNASRLPPRRRRRPQVPPEESEYALLETTTKSPTPAAVVDSSLVRLLSRNTE